jgi:hypothetical protein
MHTLEHGAAQTRIDFLTAGGRGTPLANGMSALLVLWKEGGQAGRREFGELGLIGGRGSPGGIRIGGE